MLTISRKKILFWRWKVSLALVLHKFNCLLHSHLNLIEQLSWRQIQIDQSEGRLAWSYIFFVKLAPARRPVTAEEYDEFFGFVYFAKRGGKMVEYDENSKRFCAITKEGN